VIDVEMAPCADGQEHGPHPWPDPIGRLPKRAVDPKAGPRGVGQRSGKKQETDLVKKKTGAIEKVHDVHSPGFAKAASILPNR